MFINQIITKNILENIITNTFLNFGFYTTSSLLDSLKLLGFQFATISGISLSIEDLKTPYLKVENIKKTNNQISKMQTFYDNGFISLENKFQETITLWYRLTENLKKEIVSYYKKFEPINNLYIMSSSGARGNIDQARQLIGMRGLMADQNGTIITLPIKSNFREGLSCIDYIISSYGARKGIVDTALKTADSGYLTRRLVYLAQELVIRTYTCSTQDGILIFFDNKIKNKYQILGKHFTSIYFTKNKSFIKYKKPKLIDYKFFIQLKENQSFYIKIKSPLTCKLINSICQVCYG
jgi:DNA-directed RNA polymerase subunit beta'